MGHVKKQIEDNFKNLKESLAHHKQNNLPRLPNIQKEWYANFRFIAYEQN